MSDATLRSLRYGDELIAFSLRVQPARTAKRIAIHVEPDGRVRVDVPQETSDAAVQAALQRRVRWISSQVAAVRERLAHAVPRAHVSGESLLYLGRRYVLEVVVDESRDGHVRLRGTRIEVAVADGDASRVRTLLDTWYRKRAGEVLAARLAALAPLLHWVGTPPPMQLRIMQTRWGSCSPAGRLTLNPNLVKAPRECIDYVLIHELCHLGEHNHGPRFHRLLETLMPQWRSVKARLDGLVEQLMPP
ncbi:SprT family zinc-dependent metalloprotease [Variovorax guangxiensis]|uniref:M48 family metallopeptidase n=1 Tax=Variovorax guangxiensis TaxID=1775474 RepID=UPI00285DA32B|nr:SprT family zinc-dependent metalloprotease [Variovorax guangxiensis]MDR6854302.1 putative metal-dependent hydrolase [Variovorax guangxiensis]